MQITFYQRRPQFAYFSLERVFIDIRRSLPSDINAKVAVSRFASRGIWGRVYNIIEAVFRQGDVNHITGDVHYLALLLNRKKTLLTIADLVVVHRLKGIKKIVFLFLWYWLPIKRSALVTVISESTKEDLLHHVKVNPLKVRVIHCPVSDEFKPAPMEFNKARPIILHIGITSNKNLERVAEALRDIPCHLRVIGRLNTSQTKLIQSCEVDYSSVWDLSLEEVIEEYKRCDMLVFASTYEGFGLPIIEAQATGRPVVTSNILSMPEVAGEAACLVDPFNVASIRGGVYKVVQDPEYRAKLVRDGFENVTRFRPKKIAAQFVELYRELASNTKGKT